MEELVKEMRSTAGCFTACTGPVNQMGRCSRLITVRLRSFFFFWYYANTTEPCFITLSFPVALNKSLFPALFVMWVNKAPAPGRRAGEGSRASQHHAPLCSQHQGQTGLSSCPCTQDHGTHWPTPVCSRWSRHKPHQQRELQL